MTNRLPRLVCPEGCVIPDDYHSIAQVEVGKDDNGRPIYEPGLYCRGCNKNYLREELKPFVSIADGIPLIAPGGGIMDRR